MKKMLVAVVLTLFSLSAKSQNYIGLSKSQIFSDTTLKDEVGQDRLVDGTPFLIIRNQGTNHYTRRYFFDKVSGICNIYILEPSDQQALSTFTKFCTANYDCVSDNRWKTRLNGFNVTVSLEKGSVSDQYYFFFETRGETTPHR
jgi:hypothetical protein